MKWDWFIQKIRNTELPSRSLLELMNDSEMWIKLDYLLEVLKRIWNCILKKIQNDTSIQSKRKLVETSHVVI